MTSDQTVNEATCDLAPEQRPLSVIVRAFRHQGPSQGQERFIAAAQALNQLRFGRSCSAVRLFLNAPMQ